VQPQRPHKKMGDNDEKTEAEVKTEAAKSEAPPIGDDELKRVTLEILGKTKLEELTKKTVRRCVEKELGHDPPAARARVARRPPTSASRCRLPRTITTGRPACMRWHPTSGPVLLNRTSSAALFCWSAAALPAVTRTFAMEYRVAGGPTDADPAVTGRLSVCGDARGAVPGPHTNAQFKSARRIESPLAAACVSRCETDDAAAWLVLQGWAMGRWMTRRS